jgi:hypothetical protein
MQTAIDRVMKTGLADNLKALALMVLGAVQRNGPSLGGATGAVRLWELCRGGPARTQER